MDDQVPLTGKPPHDPLSYSPNRLHLLPKQRIRRRSDGTKYEWAEQVQAFEGLAHDARGEPLHVYGDVG